VIVRNLLIWIHFTQCVPIKTGSLLCIQFLSKFNPVSVIFNGYSQDFSDMRSSTSSYLRHHTTSRNKTVLQLLLLYYEGTVFNHKFPSVMEPGS